MGNYMENGRPLEWKPEYNDKVIELAKTGLFLEEIAECFEVDYWTMNAWRRNKRCIGFSQSYTRARNIVLSNLKRGMLTGGEQKGFSPRGHQFLIEQMTKPQLKGFAKKSGKGKIEVVMKALEQEKITSSDFNNVLNGLKTAAELLHADEALAKLERIEERN
jgi:hypothetical protein